MGSIRSSQIKRISKEIVIGFQDQLSVDDFEQNKRVVQNVTDVSSRHMRNRIAGYITHLMRLLADSKVQTLESLEI